MVCGTSKNDMIFGDNVCYSQKNKLFVISSLRKLVKKCPRDVKTALEISGVGEC